MSVQTELNPRYQSILKATVESYIATAEPVGSKALLQKYDFNISSATIRNVMGRLEAAGLLYQPHTSAGRIPSDSGYRMYVDRLIIPDKMVGQKLEYFLLQQLSREKASFEALIQRLTKILATLSGYIAIITVPQNSSEILHHLQLVPVSSERIMLIIVTDSYQTESLMMKSSCFFDNEIIREEEAIAEKLQILSNFLNYHLKGLSLVEISTLNWEQLDRDSNKYTDLLQILSQELSNHLQNYNDSPLVIHGIAEVLRQPEFSELEQVQTLFSLLEKKQEQLLPLIFAVSDSETIPNKHKVTIKIGSENPLKPMQACSLIAANYYANRTPLGSVGIIGPTRMLYDNTIALVETTADYLSDICG